MSASDVLAVLSALEVQTRQRGGSPSCVTIAAAHAAVAELIEAAAAATEERYHDGISSREACDRLLAAVARAQGVQS